MNNLAFLKKYQTLQTGITFDEITNLGFATLGYSKNDKSTFWNYAFVGKNINSDELATIERKMKELKRTPALYFENNDDFAPTRKLLKENGYEKDYEDSWMFYAGDDVDLSKGYKVKKVESEEDLKVFLKTFNSCYRKDDPQNPYDELGDYLQVAESAWRKHQSSDKLQYYIAYKEDNPVSVSTLTNHEDIGYISNVGSLCEVRGEGFGKFATLYCVDVSKKRGNKIHCLVTEEGTFPNEFYKRIGFETKFTAIAYKKEKDAKTD